MTTQDATTTTTDQGLHRDQADCGDVACYWHRHYVNADGTRGWKSALAPRPLGTAEALLISSTADVNRWARIAATRPLTRQEARMQANAQDQAIRDRSEVEAAKEAQAAQARQATIQAASLTCGHRAADLLSGACQGQGCQDNCPEWCNHEGACADARQAIHQAEAWAEGAYDRMMEAGYPGYDYDPNDAYAQDR